MTKPCVLTVAGSDSSGGAGIQADIKAISAVGAYAASVVTAVTAQNTRAVTDIFTLPVANVAAQLDAIFDDLTVACVKTGMLSSAQIIEAACARLATWDGRVVVDPVMVSQSGCRLIDDAAFAALKARLLPLAFIVTPNVPEAEVLLDGVINTPDDMQTAAEQLARQYDVHVLLKGGHLSSSSAQCTDVFYNRDTRQIVMLDNRRVDTVNMHGTGCTLASALAAFLVLQANRDDVERAVRYANAYVHRAILAAADWRLGHGYGPVDHFFAGEHFDF